MGKENRKKSKALYFVCGAALTAAGFIIIPPLMKKYSNKCFKASIENDEIDFENLGPEIVRKEDVEEE